jgi:hypothetical protein
MEREFISGSLTSSCAAQTAQDLGDDDRTHRRRSSHFEILHRLRDAG